ncbi:MAG: hypothetical protein K6D98_01285 [Clostridiales bacterium]|nr:hypothetical protein [Clostridiales bacterium]
MKTIDIRLTDNETKVLRSLIGKKFESFLYDSFNIVNSSSQAAQINIEGSVYYIYSFTEPLDYFGKIDDVSVWTWESERYPVVDKKRFSEQPVQKIINNIILVQENRRLYKGKEQLYDFWHTRAIIFDFGKYQLSFEKLIWYSEDILFQGGRDPADHLAKIDDFVHSDWDKGLKAKCSREKVYLA